MNIVKFYKMHGTYIKITQYEVTDVLFWHFMQITRKILSRESLSPPSFETWQPMAEYCYTKLLDGKSLIH